MEPVTVWRFEINNPLASTEWRPLWQIDEDQLAASQELRDELNIINAPIQLRIVRKISQLDLIDPGELPPDQENLP